MKILCAGEMLADILVHPVERVKLQNETCQVREIRITHGGDANNNAVDLVKLGHQVIYLGRVGCDDMGDYVLSLAKKAGICMDHAVRSDTAAQAKSLILISPDGDRTFLQELGTSAEFCFEDCDLSLLDEADPIEGSYLFEVSSAGAERPLKRPEDFRRFMGSPVTVKLYKARDGRKEFAGVLAGYEDGAVTVTLGDQALTFAKEEVALCRLRVEF